MADIKSVISDMALKAESVQSGGSDGEKARRAIIDSALKLVNELETPNEFISRTFWVDGCRNAAMRIGSDLDVYNQLVSTTSDQGLSSAELAKPTNAQPELVDRVMRNLAANYIVREAGPDRYTAIQKTHVLAQDAYISAVNVCFEWFTPLLDPFRQQVRERGFRSPEDCYDSPFTRAFNTKLQAYAWMGKERPDLGKNFMKFMTIYRAHVPKWWDSGFYPVQERLAHADLTDNATLIVDVAGGLGHDLQKFCEQHAKQLPGSIFLEDVPEVIDIAKASGSLDSRIEAIKFDFFELQPIKGARVYHMHSILHNWPDKQCHEILNRICEAMTPGYSKLIIFDIVIPEKGAKATQMAEDLLMGMIFGARERSRKQWEELLKPHGLTITGIWSHEFGEESCIEAELVK